MPLRKHVISPLDQKFRPCTPSSAWSPSRSHISGKLMSLPSRSNSKKRKQAAVTGVGEEALQPALKKSKHSPVKPKKDKSKAGHSTSTAHETSSSSMGEFQTITSTLSISIPPIYAMEPRRGVQEMLDGMLMRYGFW